MYSGLSLLLSGIIFIFSIVVAASPDDSDLSLPLPFGDPLGQDTLLYQTTSDSNQLDPSLFDIGTSPTDPLDEFNVSQNLDGIDPSELLLNGDNSFQLAGSGSGSSCSASSDIPLTALGKRSRRVKRSGEMCHEKTFYPVPAFMLPVPFDPPNHSKTCWELTFGVLPFAVFSADEDDDGIIDVDKSKVYTVGAHVQYQPYTIYRATISMLLLLHLFSLLDAFFRHADLLFSNRYHGPPDTRWPSRFLL